MDGVDIRVERARLGLRQYRVAQALGIPQTTLSAIEHGKKAASPEQAARIIEVMRYLAALAAARESNGRAA